MKFEEDNAEKLRLQRALEMLDQEDDKKEGGEDDKKEEGKEEGEGEVIHKKKKKIRDKISEFFCKVHETVLE